MADDEILRRLDEHTERGNELMSEVRQEMRLSREQHADLREFIREQTVRAERVTDRQVTALDALVLRQDEGIAALRQMRVEIREELRDLRAESRAQTQALMKVIDRL